MKVLDLCAGHGSATAPWMARGHEVVGVDLVVWHGPRSNLKRVPRHIMEGDILEIAKDPLGWLDRNVGLGWRPAHVHSSNPCFPGRELVLTARGHVPIKDVRVGDLVLTHKGRWRPVLRIGSKNATGSVILKGYGVASIEATPEHPFYLRSRENPPVWNPALHKKRRVVKWGKAEWLPAAKAEGLYWAIPKTVDPLGHDGILANPYIIGRWLGDGWTSKREVHICTGLEDAPNLERLLFEHSGYAWRNGGGRTATRFSLADFPMAEWLERWFGAGAHGKRLPGWIFGMPPTFRAEVLRGYLDADGCIKKDGYRASSVSKALAHGIVLLAQTLGYSATLHFNERPSTAMIEGRTVNQSDIWQILILPVKEEGAHRQRHDLDPAEPLVWGKVKSVRSRGWVAPVYNLEVAEDNSYTINNVVVHNCEGFAVPSIGRMWEKHETDLIPKHPTARMALKLLAAAARIVQVLEADALEHGRTFTWTFENPRAMMRRAVAAYHPWMGPPQEVAYCMYGPLGPVEVMHGPPFVYAQKSTDIWSNFATWEPLMCHARPPKAKVGKGPPGMEEIAFTYRDGKPCHERAERGSRAGIQRIKGADSRALLPAALSLAWCIAAEIEHSAQPG